MVERSGKDLGALPRINGIEPADSHPGFHQTGRLKQAVVALLKRGKARRCAACAWKG